MQTSTARAAEAYRTNHVITRSPLELVVMLYDAAIAALSTCVEQGDGQHPIQRGEAISRTLGIVAHLQETLDMDQGGAVATELDRLYAYMVERVTTANVTRTTEPLHEVHRLMCSLREAWAQVAAESV